MYRVPACLARQGMEQQPAFRRSARSHQLGDRLKVAPRLFVGPRRTSGREWLQPQSCGKNGMTIVTAHTIRTLFKKNRLDATSIGLIVERRLGLYTALRRHSRRSDMLRLRRKDERNGKRQQH